jgi:hypothetical protein
VLLPERPASKRCKKHIRHIITVDRNNTRHNIVQLLVASQLFAEWHPFRHRQSYQRTVYPALFISTAIPEIK